MPQTPLLTLSLEERRRQSTGEKTSSRSESLTIPSQSLTGGWLLSSLSMQSGVEYSVSKVIIEHSFKHFNLIFVCFILNFKHLCIGIFCYMANVFAYFKFKLLVPAVSFFYVCTYFVSVSKSLPCPSSTPRLSAWGTSTFSTMSGLAARSRPSSRSTPQLYASQFLICYNCIILITCYYFILIAWWIHNGIILLWPHGGGDFYKFFTIILLYISKLYLVKIIHIFANFGH